MPCSHDTVTTGVQPDHAHLLEGWSAVCRILPMLLLAFTLLFLTGLLLSASAVQRLAAPPGPAWFGPDVRFNPDLKRPATPEVEGWLRALLLAVLVLLLLTIDDGAPKADAVLLAVLAA